MDKSRVSLLNTDPHVYAVQMREKADKKLYNMIDVLREGNMR